jgi:hypothetical protein
MMHRVRSDRKQPDEKFSAVGDRPTVETFLEKLDITFF